MEHHYAATTALTRAQLQATFGTRAVELGWEANGGWDDTDFDGAAYVAYCREMSGIWYGMSVYRAPATDGTYPIDILVEAYVQSRHCPGRPTGG